MLLAAAQDVDRLIQDLGRDDVSARGDAWKALVDVGEPALPPLRKALYHEEPDVRVQAKELVKAIQRKLALKPFLDPILASIGKVRARWKARDFDDLEAAAREAFQPTELLYFHYVPKKEIGARLESDSGCAAGGGFRPLQPGGLRDLLTPAIAQALDGGPGVVFLNARLQSTDVSDVILFTLPDRTGGWSAYGVVRVAGAPPAAQKGVVFAADRFRSRLLASADSRQVWGLDEDEIDWVRANFDEILAAHVTLAPQAGGGLRVNAVAPGGIAASRGFLAGDLIRDLNGQPLNTVADLKAMVDGIGKQNGARFTVERGGKPVILEYRPLPR